MKSHGGLPNLPQGESQGVVADHGSALLLLLVAFNLRGALVALAPVMDQVRRDTGLTASSASLLLTLPVLACALFSPVAPRLARRWGIERVLAMAMLVLAAGVVMRLLTSEPALFAGTLGVGVAIAVGNVLLPALVKRDFPDRIGLMTGAYVTVMSTGATLAAGTTILVQQASGLAWRATLALWAIPAIAALWACQARSAARGPGSEPAVALPVVRGLYRNPIAWQVTLFMGLQSLIFYSTVAWLPSLLLDRGFSERDAGLLFGGIQLISLPASLVAPWLAGRHPTQRGMVIAASALTGVGLVGVVFEPASAPVLWMVLLGIGQGATFGVALAIIGLRSSDSAHTAQLSSMAQSIGYLIAAIGPVLLGWIHQITGSWTLAFLVTLLALAFQLLTGLSSARDRQIGSARPT